MKLPEFIIYKIKEANQRITAQKKVLLGILLDNEYRMMNVQEIKSLIPENTHMDDVTIYRNLNAFINIGIVEQSMSPNGTSLFKLTCEQGHHHHFICLSCGKVLAFPCDNDFIHTIAKSHKFQESYHNLEVFGKCEECLNKAKKDS